MTGDFGRLHPMAMPWVSAAYKLCVFLYHFNFKLILARELLPDGWT